MGEIRNSNKTINLPWLLAIALVAGVLIGTYLADPGPVLPGSSVPAAKFREVITQIDRHYVDSVDVEALTETAIESMLRELDPHTTYMPARELALSNMRLKGGYDGIGIRFDIIRDTLVVVKAIPGGPAARAGLHTGDRILAVDGRPLTGSPLRNRDVTDRLLGEAGSRVKITVLPYGSGQVRELEMERAKIPQKTVVAAYMAAPETGYIKLVSFGRHSYEEFRKALQKLLDAGMKKLIFDLQGNGGGYMAAAERIADELLAGEVLIVSQKGKLPQYNNEVRAGRRGLFESQPLIVLLDDYAASASEIVAGALQDNDRALIMGRRSYGKGLVQMPVKLVDGSELRLTIARYYTPSGRSIQKPYVKGSQTDYAHDILQRYEHGEFFYQDSIRLNDSLVFTTRGGRKVYGGGGIMPDIFVPYDSTLNTDCYNNLIIGRVLREFTLTYYLEHKEELERTTLEDYLQNFRVTPAMLGQILEAGRAAGVMCDSSGLAQARSHIRAYVKGEIARIIWDDAGFYPAYNAVSNKAYLEALKKFDEARSLLALHQGQ